MVVDDPSHPLLERRATKIDQQPYGLMGKTKVGQQLFGVNDSQPFDRLDLDEQSLVYKQVDAKRGIEPYTLEFNSYRLLTRDPITCRREFARKDCFIDAFKKSGTEIAVYPQRKVEHVTTDLVNVSHFFSASPRLRVIKSS
nr:hypothetical protein [Arthrobacter sp. TPD3018]